MACKTHSLRIAKLLFFFILATFLAVTPARAQQSNTPTPQENIRRNEFGVWGSISFDATTWIGYTPDARFGNIGLRYGRVLAANRNLAFSWTIDAVPVAVLSVKRFTTVPTGTGSFTVRETRDQTYGAGLSPIGLKLNFRRSKLLQPFASGSAGFLYFSEQVPITGASQFNFTFEFGGGVDIVRDGRHGISVGYKYQHISNGYTSPLNPGIDVQMIHVGYSVRR